MRLEFGSHQKCLYVRRLSVTGLHEKSRRGEIRVLGDLCGFVTTQSWGPALGTDAAEERLSTHDLEHNSQVVFANCRSATGNDRYSQ